MHANIKTIMQTLFLITGVSFLIYGVVRGEASAVLAKAGKVCLECIGIG